MRALTYLLWAPAFVYAQNLNLSSSELSEALQNLSAPPDLLRLIDRQHPLSENHVPPTLVSLDQYREVLILNKTNMKVDSRMIPDLIAMTKAAGKEGVLLDISSAYRSLAYQKNLYEKAVASSGESQARKEVAFPGTSQHQLGTALDFGSITPEFAYTPAGRWLAEHAEEFGFSLSYPEGAETFTGYIFESWHYRYLGKDVTSLIRHHFHGIQAKFLIFWNDYQKAHPYYKEENYVQKQ